jgi:ribosomal protein S18 acetylase RimI-like enzyme
MNIEIRKLTPDLAEDYVRFFDLTPHNQKRHNVKCYCVFWCNDDSEGKDFNSKSDCLKCKGWQEMNGKRKGFIPTEESTPEIRIKSVFCFAIAPKMQRQGIASRLLERVCQDAAKDGFDYVEAYPDKEVTAKSEDFVGYADMYKKIGFTLCHETNLKLVMRKPLK